MDNIGGAEMVVLTLARELHAPVYTTNINQDMIRAMGFSDVTLHSIGTIPINAPLRQQLASLRFRFLNLRDRYDCVIIAGDWAISGAVNHNALWYVHSPIRELWDSYRYVRNEMVPWYKRPFFDLWVRVNRRMNRSHVHQAKAYVCNSENTRARLKNFLEVDGEVIHPPVDTGAYHYRPHEGYWLSVNRLINHKRIEVQLEAFKNLPHERLVIVGSYEQSNTFTSYAESILNNLPPNVTVISWVPREQLLLLYGGCIGCITTARDEDFGMTAVEAMASGKPVIAPNEGGYRESIVPGETGWLLDSVSGDALTHAIIHAKSRASGCRKACEARAQQYDTKHFIAAIKEQLAHIAHRT